MVVLDKKNQNSAMLLQNINVCTVTLKECIYLVCLSMLATLRCSHREFRRFICSLTSESSSSLRFPSPSKAAPARRTRPTLPWWVVSSTMYP